jgi:hypothetical protein
MGLFKKTFKSENEKIKEKKFKFSTVKYPLEDILYFFENTDLPEALYVVNANGDIDLLEVMMDFDDHTNAFFDKGYYLNKDEYPTLEELKSIIIENKICDSYNYLTIKCISDENDPSLLKEAIRKGAKT